MLQENILGINCLVDRSNEDTGLCFARGFLLQTQGYTLEISTAIKEKSLYYTCTQTQLHFECNCTHKFQKKKVLTFSSHLNSTEIQRGGTNTTTLSFLK